ncbi:MAG: hypothetical protein ACYCWW_04295, partial [Deltaproteobacteria bacterium]
MARSFVRRGMRRFAPAFALVALASSGCVHAPTAVKYVIEGQVVDSRTGAPVPYAEVHVRWPTGLPPALEPGFATVRTGPLGRFWVAREAARPATFCLNPSCGRPISVDEGNAVGTALTVRCHGCSPTSVGIGESSMDFLAHGPRQGAAVLRSVARPAEVVRARRSGLTVVRYVLPAIPVEFQERAPMGGEPGRAPPESEQPKTPAPTYLPPPPPSRPPAPRPYQPAAPPPQATP